MDYSEYRKILKSKNNMNTIERKKLLKIYLQTPSLPKLQAIRGMLLDLKITLNRCNISQKSCAQAIRKMLCKKRSV